ncbi:serine/threonine protein kinase [Fusarium proliferatum]|uniref:Serine/threonine protein kinase n=1 Tax=Gibberella intermedia TaxID=948311 RepID=A0A365NCS6_GIBIN|nr:serine/threonine protein kinase [Fusarium proliferatum]
MPNPNSNADCENLDTLPAKCATLQFFDASDPKWATEKPFYSNIPFTQTKIANTNVINTSARVQISDIRGHESDFTLDKNGFQLVNWKHKFSDVGPSFQEEGYPAVVKFMKEVLGSHVKVCVFDHIVRQSQPRGSAPEDEKGYIGRPSKVAHNDQTYEGTIAKIKHDFGSQAPSILSQRFRIINVWKPLKPVRQYPLTLCDYRTCDERDGHRSDLVYPHVVSENILFSYSKDQKWYYVSDQSDEEVWLIKTMDSLARTEDVAMYTPHTSFFDEDPAVAEEIRESIELRVRIMERTRSHSRGRPTDADKKRYEDEPMTRESSPGECDLVCPQPTKAQPWKQALQVERDSGSNPLLNWEPNAMDFGEKPWLKIDWSKIEGTGPGGVRSKSPDQMCGYSGRKENYFVFAPRALDSEEKDQIYKASRYRRIRQENEVVNASTKKRQAIVKARPGKEGSSPGQSSYRFTTEAPDVPDTSQIPLFHSMTQVVPSMEPKDDATPDQILVVENTTTDGVGRTLQSLYAIQVASGETSKVFGVETRLSLNGHLSDSKDVVRKCAVKRLHKSTSAEQFWAEYESLKRVKRLNHPHLIETLSVFRSKMGRTQHFNFLFPLALSNLKRLFQDSHVPVPLRSRDLDSLWGQIPGLSSAVAYLHDSAHMAHRDIKPSNILIYEEPWGNGLSLKLTDFGLSIDLSRVRTWEQGSRARQSAWVYDSPEVRNASPVPGVETSTRIKIPSPSDLMANDIWKLGCVFTELLAYLVAGGSSGVEAFRDYITTTEDNISSDVFNDTRFDDGEQVKPQVLKFINQMAYKDYRAGMLQSMIKEMLAKSALRPTIAEVCEELAEKNFPGINFNDGLRLIRFVAADSLAPSPLDLLRQKLERWAGRPIDWAPLSQPLPKLDADGYMATWEWHGAELALALSRDEFDRYKATCFPVTTNNIPLLPLTRQGLKAQQATKPSSHMQSASLGQPSQSSPSTNILAANAPPAVKTSVDTKDIYWCIERNFTEPTEIYLSPIENAEMLDDEQLFRQVNKAISSTEGWVRRLFSWKRCTEIDFVQFLVIWENKNQVNPIQKELPPPTTPFYDHSVPLPHDFHVRAAGLQMVFGLRDPKKGRGETTIVDMLPKKRNPPPFSKRISEPGWGLHAKMGFSQRRFLAWLVFCIVLGGIFVVAWLVLINPTDLQNAFIPSFLFAALLTIAMGLLQIA